MPDARIIAALAVSAMLAGGAVVASAGPSGPTVVVPLARCSSLDCRTPLAPFQILGGHFDAVTLDNGSVELHPLDLAAPIGWEEWTGPAGRRVLLCPSDAKEFATWFPPFDLPRLGGGP